MSTDQRIVIVCVMKYLLQLELCLNMPAVVSCPHTYNIGHEYQLGLTTEWSVYDDDNSIIDIDTICSNAKISSCLKLKNPKLLFDIYFSEKRIRPSGKLLTQRRESVLWRRNANDYREELNHYGSGPSWLMVVAGRNENAILDGSWVWNIPVNCLQRELCECECLMIIRENCQTSTGHCLNIWNRKTLPIPEYIFFI